MKQQVSARHEPASRSTGHGKRLDIQGLRMVAVVAVVVNHLTGHPRGAFVGVDVFFVISGYLITSLLIRDLDQDQTLGSYVTGFYRRRVRRLIPAALVVTVATIAAGKLLLNSSRFATTWHDGIWGTFFSINWHLASIGTDYFGAAAPPSPFQHYWSLSVEEQFYLAWPILLFAAGLIAARLAGPDRRRAVGAAVAGLLCVFSLSLAVAQSNDDATYAYFSSLTRAWELGLGALLACVGGALKAPRIVLTVMSWTGLVAIAVSFFVVSGGPGFPFPGALLPCLGAVLVLAAATADERASNVILTNPGSVFVGDISYSVYLVHFPVIVLLASRMPDRTWQFYAIGVALIIGLSVALYGFVEQPVLRSDWLQTNEGIRRRRRGGITHNVPRFREYGVTVAATVVLSLVLLVFWQQDQNAAQIAKENAVARALGDTPSPAPTGPTSNHTTSPVKTPLADALHRRVAKAAQATQWPTLSPSMDTVLSGSAFPPEVGKCGDPTLIADQCVFGDRAAPHTIEVVGDSQAIAWTGAFRGFVAAHPAWNVRVAGGFACVFADQVIAQDSGEFTSHCPQRNRDVVADIEATRPDLLVVSDRWLRPSDLVSTGNEIEKVQSYVNNVVMLGPPPPVTDPHVCYQPGSVPVDCLSKLEVEQPEIVANEQGLVDGLGGTFIDTTDWFCAGGYCPAFEGTTPTYFDSGHITESLSLELGPVLGEALRDAHVL
jgi:peptidoglycan/LPS O-acetylase OafA/YrhL